VASVLAAAGVDMAKGATPTVSIPKVNAPLANTVFSRI
jgi:hypothetical protein